MLDIEKSIAYDRWANACLIRRLATEPDPPLEALDLLSHLLASIEVWLTRIEGGSSADLEIWPSWTISECTQSYERSRAATEKVARELGPGSTDREIRYENQQGESFVTAVGDILSHVIVHGVYHRGQIATVLRASGRTPVNTDYITYVRAGAPSEPSLEPETRG